MNKLSNFMGSMKGYIEHSHEKNTIPHKTNLPQAPNKISMPECKPPKVESKYDYRKNIENLVERYTDKINRLNVDCVRGYVSIQDQGLHQGLNNAINDLKDILNEEEI